MDEKSGGTSGFPFAEDRRHDARTEASTDPDTDPVSTLDETDVEYHHDGATGLAPYDEPEDAADGATHYPIITDRG